MKRPDLAIYSQLEQLIHATAPSWDSPDITSCELPSNVLLKEVAVTVRNLSAECPAIGALISLYSAAFGIGMPRSLVGQTTATLAPTGQVTLSFPLPQALLSISLQPVGFFVTLQHPADVNPVNNIGGQNLAGVSTAAAGRTLKLPVSIRNPANAAQTISLELMPNFLGAAIQPTILLGPLSQLSVPIELQVPTTVHGTTATPVRLDATLIARGADGGLIDGLTFAIWVDD